MLLGGATAVVGLGRCRWAPAGASHGARDGRGVQVLWHNMREEPVLYINGQPYVVREADKVSEQWGACWGACWQSGAAEGVELLCCHCCLCFWREPHTHTHAWLMPVTGVHCSPLPTSSTRGSTGGGWRAW